MKSRVFNKYANSVNKVITGVYASTVMGAISSENKFTARCLGEFPFAEKAKFNKKKKYILVFEPSDGDYTVYPKRII